ncbi:MAG TPA: hypothetical protein VG604_00090 [Candidatus Saccharimonadales bacterium]|nr:hypothetical protein [Candidatus Saccharimonadales bacterium]
MIKKILQLSATLSILLSMLLSSTPVFAASGSISLSCDDSTVASGQSFVVAIYMNGGGNAVNAVEADLSYPASQIQYVGFSATGSAFEIGASSGGGGGTVTIDRGTTGGVKGSALVGTVTFKALVGSGSATINVASSSSLVAGGAAVPYGSSGVSVGFGSSVSSGDGDSGSSSSSGTSKTPTAPKDVTAPKITGVKTANVTSFSADITWATNEAADSVVQYGLDTHYGLSASSATKTKSHSVALGSAFLEPLTLLHYRVQSTDAAGNVATSPDYTLQLPGVAVTVVVKGPDGQPVSGANVTLNNKTGQTDSHGQVILPGALGNNKITTIYQGVTVQKSITVAKSTKPLPPVQLDLSRQPADRWMVVSAGLVVVVVILLGLDAVLFGSKWFSRFRRSLPKVQVTFAGATASPVAAPAVPAKKPQREPPVDANKTLNQLVDDAKEEPSAPKFATVEESEPESTDMPVTPSSSPATGTAVSQSAVKIGHFSPTTTAPIVIKLQPTEESAPIADVKPAVPLAPEAEASSPSADLAPRLKKPAAKKPHSKPTKTKKD